MSTPQTGRGCATSVAISLASLAAFWFVAPLLLTALFRWRGVAENQSPEALAYLFLIVVSPFMIPLSLLVAGLISAFAGLVVDRRLHLK